MGQCNKCNGARQVRYLFNGVCAACIKNKSVSKSVVNVPLNNDHMMNFNGNDSVNDKQVDPDDSISMVGTKRSAQKPLNFKEVMYEVNDNNGS